MIDPVKELQAAKLKIDLGVSSREKEAIEINGTEFNDNIRQLGKEAELIRNYIGKEEENE